MSDVNALSQVEAQRLGDRLRNLIGIIGSIGGAVGSIPGGLAGFLDNFDLSKLTAVIEAFKAIGAATDTKAKVLAGLEALKQLVLLTTTTADDTIVNAIAGIVGNEAVLDFIVGLIGKMEAAETAKASGRAVALSDDDLARGAPVNASAFNIGLWITIAKTLFSLFQLFTKKPATA